MQPISLNQINPYRVQPIRFGQSEQQKNTSDEIAHRKAFAEAYNKTVQFANLGDRQLLNIAKLDASRDDKYKFNTYAAMLVGIPVADTFIRGLTSEAPHLSGKLKTMGKVGAGWIGALALAGIYNGVVDKVTGVSPVVKRTEERHPVISSLLRLAGFAALLIGATKGVAKLKGSFATKFPGTMEDLLKLKSSVANKINNSAFNKKIVSKAKEKLVNFAEKHPKIAGTTLTSAILLTPLLAAGTLFKSIADQSEKADKINDTYKKLVNTRELCRNKLDELHSGSIKSCFNKEINEFLNEPNNIEV